MNSLKHTIRQLLRESLMAMEANIDYDMVDEERITNPESKFYVQRRENFIASHIFGEDLGDLGLMYVTYSYGEQYPAYLWHKNKWYYNTDDFINPDGSINEFTKKHMEDMRPTHDAHGISGRFMHSMIKKFMRKHHLQRLDHVSVEPGEKN